MGLSDAFGANSAVSQIFVWQVAAQIINALMSPTLELVAQKINADNPVVDLTPADLAQLVVRNYRSRSSAAAEAARSGIDGDKFADMVHIAGDAPAPGDLAVALRRGLIPLAGSGVDATSFEQGIREGRLGDKWTKMMQELSVQWPTPTDALDALLEGQISQADAEALYRKLGGDPQFFTMLFNTRGNAPTPSEALDLANRGIIPWNGTGPSVVSYEQAFLEGPWRNKWLKPFEALGEYLPPPRTVTAMVSAGSLSPEQGTQLLLKQGLSKELAAAYISDALNTQNQADKELTAGQLLDMYEVGLISTEHVTPLLSALGYSQESIDLLLAYRDVRRAVTAVNTAVARIHSLYTTYKIDGNTARNSLASLGVPGTQVNDIVAVWDIERAANVKVLTASEIADAWKYTIITEDEALSELQALGYTPRDAWIYLSVKNKAPLDNQPAPGPAAPAGTPPSGAQ